MRAVTVVAMMMLAAGAEAQTLREHETLDVAGLQRVAEGGGLRVVAIESGNMMVSDGQGRPARLSLAGCDVHGQCRVVRIYTRYLVGSSSRGMAAVDEFSRS